MGFGKFLFGSKSNRFSQEIQKLQSKLIDIEHKIAIIEKLVDQQLQSGVTHSSLQPIYQEFETKFQETYKNLLQELNHIRENQNQHREELISLKEKIVSDSYSKIETLLSNLESLYGKEIRDSLQKHLSEHQVSQENLLQLQRTIEQLQEEEQQLSKKFPELEQKISQYRNDIENISTESKTQLLGNIESLKESVVLAMKEISQENTNSLGETVISAMKEISQENTNSLREGLISAMKEISQEHTNSLRESLLSVVKEISQEHTNSLRESLVSVMKEISQENTNSLRESFTLTMKEVTQENTANLEAKFIQIVKESEETIEKELTNALQKLEERWNQTLALEKEKNEQKLENIQDHISEVKKQLEERVAKELHRLGKTLFKLNTLTETSREDFHQGLQLLIEEKEHYQIESQKFSKEIVEKLQAREFEIARQLFPLMDALDGAVEIGEQLPKKSSTKKRFRWFRKDKEEMQQEDIYSWIKGMKMLQNRVLHILEFIGVEPIPSLNCEFDPTLHRAVEIEPGPDNMILKEITKGYRSGDRILRYAEVVVGKKPEKES